MMNLLQYKNKSEFIDYLHKISIEELKQEFKISSNLYLELDRFLHTTIINIFTEFYDKPLDDICYYNIDNYDKYIGEYLNNLLKYLDSINNSLNEFVFYVNCEELEYYNWPYYLKEDNSNIKEVLTELYEKITNNVSNGIYDKLVLLANELKKQINEYLKHDNNELTTIVNNVLKTTEIICKDVIFQKDDFKELLSEENYVMLEKYNLINKLILILNSSIIGYDLADLASMFKNQKIIKIIDNKIEREFNKGNKYTAVINILIKNITCENIFSIIDKKREQLKEKYNSKDYEIDFLIGLIFGNEREITIVIGE